MNKPPDWLVNDFLKFNTLFMKRIDQLKEEYGDKWYMYSADDEFLKEMEDKIHLTKQIAKNL